MSEIKKDVKKSASRKSAVSAAGLKFPSFSHFHVNASRRISSEVLRRFLAKLKKKHFNSLNFVICTKATDQLHRAFPIGWGGRQISQIGLQAAEDQGAGRPTTASGMQKPLVSRRMRYVRPRTAGHRRSASLRHPMPRHSCPSLVVLRIGKRWRFWG